MGNTVDQKNISWQAANKLVNAAVSYAEEQGLCVNVAVVDNGGHLAAFLRMPGSAFHSIEIATNKAYTAMSFGLPTSGWQPIADSMSGLSQTGLFSTDRLLPCGGGLPVEVDGVRIAGIGVSGASEKQDEEIAQHAVKTLQQ